MARVKYDEFLLEVHQDNKIRATWTAQKGEDIRIGELGLSERERGWLHEDVRLLRQGKLDERGLERMGERLYDALFPGDINNLFKLAVEEVRGDKSRRLSVSISVDPKNEEVRGWPLEFLRCTAGEGYWLATTENRLITLSRRISLEATTYRTERHDPPLKVLIVVSRPQEPEELRGVVAAKAIEDIAKWAAVEVGEGQPGIEIRLLGIVAEFERRVDNLKYLHQPATFEKLGEVAGDWSPDVLHFIGHGKFEEDQGYLALVDDMGKESWCSAKNLAQLYVGWRPRLVVLQACESAMPATGPGFMSLAAQIMKQNIPAVVAMQFEIRNDCASVFAEGFYEALANGKDVDAAVQKGRWKIAFSSALKVFWTERDFGTPALYVLSPDGIIHPVSAVAQPAPGHEPDRAVRPFGTGPLPTSPEEEAKEMMQMAARLAAMGKWGLAQTISKHAFALSQEGKAFESDLAQARQLRAPALSSSKRTTPGG